MPTKKSIQKPFEDDESLPGKDQTNPAPGGLTEESPEDSRLAEIRLDLTNEQPENGPFVKTNSLDQFFKKGSESSTKPALTPDEEDSPFRSPFEPSEPTPEGEGRRFFPFQDGEPFPGPGKTEQLLPLNLHPRPAGDTTMPAAKKPRVTTPLKKFTQRLDAQGDSLLNRNHAPEGNPFAKPAEEYDQPFNSDGLVQPFVDHGNPFESELSDSLAVKVRNGTVPGETIRLLITASMSEAEVMAICSELNIDWKLVPGEDREEKIRYLINYFNNGETHLDYKEVVSAYAPKLPSHEEDWDDSEGRLRELQASLLEPGPEMFVEVLEDEKKLAFWDQLKEDFTQATLVQKVLVVGLSLLVVALLIMIAVVTSSASSPAVKPPDVTATPSSLPSPISLQLPGGWNFALKAGAVLDGAWNPAGPEWLQGTEICKLVSLPWNRQLDAVYQTLQPGDELLLTMSNADILHYQVTELKTLDLIDFNSQGLSQVTTASKPCLAIVLTNKETETRQMLMAIPASDTP